MSQPVVTFFIPCYNVVDCVEHCIQSMLHPDILDKIEILAVNDGSKDTTSALLHQYESKYPSIIRVIDKENGGWGTAVNLGIREAHGKYFKEVDADDWVETANLPQYISQLAIMDCDYVATDYKDYQKQTDSFVPHTFKKEVYGKVYLIDDFWNQHPDGWAFPIHAITYRTKFIQDMGLTVGDRYYTDFEYFLYPMPYVQTVCVLPLNITVYFRGSDEQSTGINGYRKNYRDYIKLSQRLVAFYQSLPPANARIYSTIRNTVAGTILFSYDLLMSPVYAGGMLRNSRELKDYNSWLKATDAQLYNDIKSTKKHGIPVIRIWQLFHINVLKWIRK